jgi:hypothetical protein
MNFIWLLGNKHNADVYQYFRMTLGWFQMVEAYELHGYVQQILFIIVEACNLDLY